MSGSMSVAGLSSGLDTQSIITKIMEYAKKTEQSLEADQAVAKTKLTVWQGFNSKVLSLNTKVAAIADAADFKTNTVTSSNEDILTASASTSADPGSYYLTVSKRAQVHQISSPTDITYASTNDVVGTGDVSFAFTDTTKNFTVSLDSNNNTLAGMRDAINRAGKGVKAAIINSGTAADPKYQLLLTSKDSGADSQFTVSNTLTGGTAPVLTKVIQQGQNAEIKLGSGADAITITKSTNTVTDLIPGVTLNLISADDTKPIKIDIARDSGTVKTAIQDFVDEYNGLVDQFKEQFSYDTSSGDTGTLFGDFQLQSVQQNIISALSNPVAGLDSSLNSLASLGITHDTDGHLQVNNSTLSKALENNMDSVNRVFSAGLDSDSTYVSFATSTSDTKSSGKSSWSVQITQAATQSRVTAGTAMADTLGADETLTVNGKDIQLKEGWTTDQVVEEINANSNDTGITVSATGYDGTGTGSYLTFKSVRYGSNTNFSVRSNVESASGTTGVGSVLISPNLTGVPGKDVEGTINGATCKGSGQILTVKDEKNDANGLSLIITANAPMTSNVKYTQGVGDRLRSLLNNMTSSTGAITQAQDSLNTTISDFDDQIADEKAKLTAKEDQLWTQFNAMESKMADLQQQGNWLSSALSSNSKSSS
ncbi:MAG: flagellar filament capping protein FliD [Armatimonadota bacterium]